MDQARYDELIGKRDGEEGLSDDEANELGRLEAQRDGVAYEGHGPNVAEADRDANILGRHKPGSIDPIENEGEDYMEDVRSHELEERLPGDER